ncbi:hypothetical protein GCM10027055_27530 [Janibacter alkaliphilus]|uniref:DUF4190 domain-containing protein n=1 Tax=Janibacter alkaliphilus TaxID=1069963 RepID=A0A852X9B6_9MICO|nr:DUF4190 domain-containing protein [Janibacter alkaliphilus]NYG38090.1 hypothetical protein [Janibacter alkaliphilus]
MTQSPTDDGPSRPDRTPEVDQDASRNPPQSPAGPPPTQLGAQPSPQPAPGPPPGYPTYPQSHSLALASLVIGIFGIISLPVLGPVAWVLANQALQQIDAAPPGAWTNREHAVAGRMLGMIGTALLVLVTVVFLAIFGISVLVAVGASAGS